MNTKLITLLFFSFLFLYACGNRSLVSNQNVEKEQMSQLVKMMSGEFSSKEQAEQDSAFYDINLVMYPIWESDQSAKWLYVEQAVTKFIDKPYRQRVYKLSTLRNGEIESSVYELPSPDKYIHGWNQPTLFNQINPDSLMIRSGCAVYLKPTGDNCYSGSTKDKECTSTLRGANYATSIVSICDDNITSWDQGWNNEGEQVWGAVKSGYIFKKK